MSELANQLNGYRQRPTSMEELKQSIECLKSVFGTDTTPFEYSIVLTNSVVLDLVNRVLELEKVVRGD